MADHTLEETREYRRFAFRSLLGLLESITIIGFCLTVKLASKLTLSVITAVIMNDIGLNQRRTRAMPRAAPPRQQPTSRWTGACPPRHSAAAASAHVRLARDETRLGFFEFDHDCVEIAVVLEIVVMICV